MAAAKTQIEALKHAIAYLKMDELRAVCLDLGISKVGRKRELITGIITQLQGGGDAVVPANKSIRPRGVQEYSLESRMRPQTYANGAKSRAFLKKEIGAHFHFTTFGMDWIKEQWAAGKDVCLQTRTGARELVPKG